MFGAFQIQPYICTVFHGIRFKVSKRLVVERQSIFFIPTPTNDDWQAVCATPFRAMNAISRNKDNGMQAMEGLLLLHLHPVVGLNGWRIHLLHSLVTCRYGKAKHRLHLFCVKVVASALGRGMPRPYNSYVLLLTAVLLIFSTYLALYFATFSFTIFSKLSRQHLMSWYSLSFLP